MSDLPTPLLAAIVVATCIFLGWQCSVAADKEKDLREHCTLIRTEPGRVIVGFDGPQYLPGQKCYKCDDGVERCQ